MPFLLWVQLGEFRDEPLAFPLFQLVFKGVLDNGRPAFVLSSLTRRSICLTTFSSTVTAIFAAGMVITSLVFVFNIPQGWFDLADRTAAFESHKQGGQAGQNERFTLQV